MKPPRRVYSHLGPVPVFYDGEPDVDGELGRWDWRDRVLTLCGDQDDACRLQVLFHEMAHVAINDVGAHYGLEEADRERISDAVGTYLAAAVQNGYLRFGPASFRE